MSSSAGARSLWVPGMPCPKPRPRSGAHGNVYTPDTGWEETIAAEWISVFGKSPCEGLVAVDILFVLGKEPGTSIIVTPISPNETKDFVVGTFDIDNAEKAVLDALSPDQSRQTRKLAKNLGIKPRGLAWDNDRQVVSLRALKVSHF